MAYLREIPKLRCAVSCCGKPARVELVNRLNSPSAVYCAVHGKQKLEALIAAENEKKP